MENELALATQNTISLCPADKKNFAVAVQKMALAKNISLASGTLGAWEDCVLEDIADGIYDLEDFMLATKRLIREPVFNRLDFADLFDWAKRLAEQRRLKNVRRENTGGRQGLPTEVKEMVAKIGKPMPAATQLKEEAVK